MTEKIKEKKLKCNDCENIYYSCDDDYNTICPNCNGELEEVKE